MSYVIIIRGPAGVGKSVVAKKLARKLNAYYISLDDVMKKYNLDKIEGDGISAENFIKADELIIPEVNKRIQKNQAVILDGCFYRKEQIKHLRSQLKVKFKIFSLNATIKECIRRNKFRKRKMSIKSIQQVYDLVTAVKIGIKILTSRKTPSKIVDEIVFKSNSA
jgi:predicted kinase